MTITFVATKSPGGRRDSDMVIPSLRESALKAEQSVNKPARKSVNELPIVIVERRGNVPSRATIFSTGDDTRPPLFLQRRRRGDQ